MSDNGAALVGRILKHLADEPACTISELAARLDAARTSAFAAVARLEAAGFVERDARGKISPGPLAARMGYATFGLAPIAGAVEALLPALRDETGSCAEFVVEGGLALARRSPAQGGSIIEARLKPPASALVRLRLRVGAPEPERAAAQRAAEAVADALSRQIQPCGSSDDRPLHDPHPCAELGSERGRLPGGERSDASKGRAQRALRSRRGRGA